MRPFTFYRIIVLLFVFGANNLFAVQTATTDPTKTDAVVSIATTETVKKSQKKSKRKSRLIERFKEKFSELFPQDNTQENVSTNENLETKTHGLAVASLVLGIIGIPGMFLGIGFLFALLAIIFGAVAKGKIRKSGGFYTGKGMATAGLILGIIPMALFVLALIILLAAGGF